MIVYRVWERGAGNTFQRKDGWFLFGILPLYIRHRTIKGRGG